MRLRPGGRWRVDAPPGLSDVCDLVVRPNPVLPRARCTRPGRPIPRNSWRGRF
ncbi:hypothetical protein [Streptomyces coeruleofuscus]|uniref:hypothetical protein n=1 Tax=Streptomyces coeruleofuscus TaxID=66879 RepID=UPI003D15CF61